MLRIVIERASDSSGPTSASLEGAAERNKMAALKSFYRPLDDNISSILQASRQRLGPPWKRAIIAALERFAAVVGYPIVTSACAPSSCMYLKPFTPSPWPQRRRCGTVSEGECCVHLSQRNGQSALVDPLARTLAHPFFPHPRITHPNRRAPMTRPPAPSSAAPSGPSRTTWPRCARCWGRG